MQTSTYAREASLVPRWSSWAESPRVRRFWTKRWRGHSAARCTILTLSCSPAAAPHLYTTCRIHYARVLLLSGQRALAEDQLTAALSVGQLVEPELHAEALALLGHLRVIQGRADEAERLIAGYEQHAAAVPVLAAVRAAQGQFEVAEWLVRRRLDLLGANPLAAADLRGLLIELELDRGKAQEALADAEALSEATSRLGISAMPARSHYLLGRALAAVGNDTAVRELDQARTTFVQLAMPYEAARSRLALARLTRAADKAAAVEEAKGALATFEELGAIPDADAAAALLREWGSGLCDEAPMRSAVSRLVSRKSLLYSGRVCPIGRLLLGSSLRRRQWSITSATC
jgi:hypothetical protein